MIDLTPTSAAAVPRDTVVSVLHDVFDRSIDAHSKGLQPPGLHYAIEEARRRQSRDDVAGLDEALLGVIHGAVHSLARIRAACPELTGGPR